ncbi:MAG: hypothetical protein QOJ31_553 [Gaiellales bacterium]|jgi:hypothetical protein|nr:hypothetical protein [Gaiellales bacterium]
MDEHADEGFELAWIEVEEGWRVLAADGSDVGDVEQGVGDRGADIFEGFEIDIGARPNRFVSYEHVTGIAQGHIRLDLSPDEVRALPPHREVESLDVSGEKAGLDDRLRTDVHEMTERIAPDLVQGTGKRNWFSRLFGGR